MYTFSWAAILEQLRAATSTATSTTDETANVEGRIDTGSLLIFDDFSPKFSTHKCVTCFFTISYLFSLDETDVGRITTQKNSSKFTQPRISFRFSQNVMEQTKISLLQKNSHPLPDEGGVYIEGEKDRVFKRMAPKILFPPKSQFENLPSVLIQMRGYAVLMPQIRSIPTGRGRGGRTR